MGKAEGKNRNWHGHVTALTVAPEYRRLGLGRQLMDELEDISEHRQAPVRRMDPTLAGAKHSPPPGRHHGYFVDLFVRKSNDVAVELYRGLGYEIYRTVAAYYSGEHPEDAYGMVGCGRFTSTHPHCGPGPFGEQT
jgi:N-terminal acetyltransferase B complex catalytic subunit